MMEKIYGFGSITFWMKRVSEEYNKIAIGNIKKSETLFFQAMNFETMGGDVQHKVIEDLVQSMKNLKWNSSIKEYFPSFSNEVVKNEKI